MATIRGRITATDGVPIAEASVFVVSGPSHFDIAAVTGNDGDYELSGLQPGGYVIRVEAAGFVGASGSVPVRAGMVTRTNVMLEADVVRETGNDTEFEMENADPSAVRNNQPRRRRSNQTNAASP